MIKGLRKSLRDNKKSSSISSPLSDKKASISSAQDIQINNNNLLQSPKRVIKALYDYKPQGPGELEFYKGDFFHVIGNENDSEWYEACNPSKNIRGMVPVPYFEVFGKTRPTVVQNASTPSSRISPSSKKLSTDSMPTSISSKSNSSTLYGVVLYDFNAERSDELDVSIGENIILCAHHDYEWFIAKPIDRLGGPGLVPVSYISVIDVLTGNSTGNDVADDINGANLPTVDEWKLKNAKYKASSIPLGNVDEDAYMGSASVAPSNTRSPSYQHSSRQSSGMLHHHDSYRNSKVSSLRNGSYQSQFAQSNTFNPNNPNNVNVNATNNANNAHDVEVVEGSPYIQEASVDSFHVDNGRYWFHLACVLSNGEARSLCRFYEDFYDFQIRLLELFPNEAGRSPTTSKRILPFIPGPLTYVTDKITQKRTIDLNDYIKELINLPNYISRSRYVKQLFDLKYDEIDKVIDGASSSSNNTSFFEQDRRIISSYGEMNDDHEATIVKDESVKTLNVGGYSNNGNTMNNIGTNITINDGNGVSSVKLKFFYRDDIFALLIPTNITIEQLRQKISYRIYDDSTPKEFKIYIKKGEDVGDEVANDEDVEYVLKNKLKMLIDDGN